MHVVAVREGAHVVVGDVLVDDGGVVVVVAIGVGCGVVRDERVVDGEAAEVEDVGHVDAARGAVRRARVAAIEPEVSE